MRYKSASFSRKARQVVLGRWLCLVAVAPALAVTAFATSPRVVITAQPGFTITWDGNNGGFSNPDPGAGPSNNVALAANGTTAFGSSEFNGGGVHLIANVNDGLYGNSHSWISDFTAPDPDPFIGLSFASSVDINSIAWSRDNGDTSDPPCGGTCMDRNVGVYTLQFTQVAAPDAGTPDTGDAATGWATLGTIEYTAGTDNADFTGYLRHRFDVAQGGAPIAASGLRIKVSDPTIDIDEIEVNPVPDPTVPISNFVEIHASPGFAISWDHNEGNFSDPSSPALVPFNVAMNGTAFGSGALVAPHAVSGVNDGQYGNSFSWISAPTDNPFIGINLGDCIPITSIAWSRDNGNVPDDCCGGTATDRAIGTYTLQFTARPDADENTPETGDALSGWQDLGTVQYKAADPNTFNPHLRHRYDISMNGGPIKAGAIRFKVSDAGIDIDEIEVNPDQILEQQLLAITNMPGISLAWDHNQGDFQNPEAGAGPPDNRALATHGATAFGSSQFDGGGVHLIDHINDGLYGNSHSWISDFTLPDPDPFIGVAFGDSITITNLAWSRDNGDNVGDPCAGGVCGDRSDGTYTLQITQVTSPDANTPETDDPLTGWMTIATITYALSQPPAWQTHLRHRFDVTGAGIDATGLRIKAPNNGTAIDELEVNTQVEAPPPPVPAPPVVLTPSAGFEITYDGNDGDYEDLSAGGGPPPNRALAGEGTTAFGSSQFDGGGNHLIDHINDGLYGNSHSWISDFTIPDPDPFIGLDFGGSIAITNIAWSRDNGDGTEAACGGTCTDRAIDLYTIQVTEAAAPDANTSETGDAATGWTTVATVDIAGDAPPTFHSGKRHRFDLSSGGAPINATGLRVKVANSGTALDELEVNTAGAVEPRISVQVVDGMLMVNWVGDKVLEGTTSLNEPWMRCINTAANQYMAPVASGGQRYFRLATP